MSCSVHKAITFALAGPESFMLIGAPNFSITDSPRSRELPNTIPVADLTALWFEFTLRSPMNPQHLATMLVSMVSLRALVVTIPSIEPGPKHQRRLLRFFEGLSSKSAQKCTELAEVCIWMQKWDQLPPPFLQCATVRAELGRPFKKLHIEYEVISDSRQEEMAGEREREAGGLHWIG